MQFLAKILFCILTYPHPMGRKDEKILCMDLDISFNF